MKLFFAALLGIFTFSFTNAQTYYTISGKVTDAATQQPMKLASVFAQNTTMGTVTDADGNFKLALPNGGYDLVITYTGYQTDSRRITTADAGQPLNVSLKEKEKDLETVAIVATNEVADGLVKYGDFFKAEFIGKSKNGAQCSIQNPEVLKFFFLKKKNKLKITAKEPLIIKNEALGYNIKYNLDSFTHEYNTEISAYTGYPLFEEMQPADDAQKLKWEAARREAYKGSALHFMRSIYSKELKAQEFEIQFLLKTNGKENVIKVKDPYGALNYQKDDSTQTVEILPNQTDVAVLFSGEKASENYIKENPGEPQAFQLSVLSFKPQESLIIEQNGYFYDQNDISISGYWAWDKVADQLPYDYRYLIQ